MAHEILDISPLLNFPLPLGIIAELIRLRLLPKGRFLGLARPVSSCTSFYFLSLCVSFPGVTESNVVPLKGSRGKR